ncbi:MAG: hypothetical protein LC745_09460, partial [Planctomycetia bacterium]|nr:hypothetical protein [Planctomycetia bacterium]
MSVAAILDALARRAGWVIVGLGILFRVAQYAADPSYWLDETSLAANIIPTHRRGIFDPLSNSQLAPPGFLALERLACAVLGGTRLALRVIPV